MNLPSAISRTTEAEERALVVGLSRSDRRVLSEFVDRTHAAVYAMTRRFTDDPDSRQDWTHDVLLRIIEEMGRGNFVYRWPGCFWSWFATRARFLLLDQVAVSARERSRQLSPEESEAALRQAYATVSDDPRRLVETVECRRVIEGCLGKVENPRHRQALERALFDESSYEEIAREMEVPLNTVRSYVRRGRIAVRRCVAMAFGWAAPEFDST